MFSEHFEKCYRKEMRRENGVLFSLAELVGCTVFAALAIPAFIVAELVALPLFIIAHAWETCVSVLGLI